jgi:hypothetical protein
VTCLVYNKTVPDDDFIKLKHVVIETQVFLLVVLTDKIKSTVVKEFGSLRRRVTKFRLFPEFLSLSLDPVVNEVNSVHNFTHYFFKPNFNIICPSTPMFDKQCVGISTVLVEIMYRHTHGEIYNYYTSC